MREASEIMKAAMKSSEIPEGYNLIEDAAFGAMRQLAVMYNRGEITKETATKNRERIYAEYNKEAKDFEFIYKLYSEYTKRVVLETESNRTELRKVLNDSEGQKITDEKLAIMLRLCMEIIESVFPGEFTGRKTDGFPEGGFR